MPAPFSNLRSKLDRAIAAYLKIQGVADNVYISLNSGLMENSTGPCVIVRAHSGAPYLENRMAGVWRFQVEIAVVGNAAPDNPEQEAAQPEQPRMDIDEVFAATVDALMVCDSGSGQDLDATIRAINEAGRGLATSGTDAQKAANADMVDFTLEGWDATVLDGGNPRIQGAPEGTTNWKELIGFEAVCCASNVGFDETDK